MFRSLTFPFPFPLCHVQELVLDSTDPSHSTAVLAALLIALFEVDDGPCATDVDTGFGINLADLPLNKDTASEVLRLYLSLVPRQYIPWDPAPVIEVCYLEACQRARTHTHTPA